MSTGTKNEVAGAVHEVKGAMKQKVGKLTNDPDLEGQGLAEEIAGKVQKKIGQVQKVVEKP
ncbi:MAG: CsbD family protein [Candidatus Acidiferrales bacterium]